MSASFSQRKKGGNEPWRSQERHYCPLCNAWMGSDRQSILLHENGKKHREAVEADLIKRRDEKSRKEKEEKDLEAVFKKVNETAAGVVGSIGGGAAPAGPFGHPAYFGGVASNIASVKGGHGSFVPPAQPLENEIKKQYQKLDSRNKKSESVASTKVETKQKEPKFDPNVGHYELDGQIFLEGKIYAQILEEGMPIQLWMGSPNVNDDEKRDLRNFNYWKTALLAKVMKDKGKDEISCHVSYLQQPDDDDETIESNVKPSRIRLVIGSDPSIPETLEEAHLALLGGEQTIKLCANNSGSAAEIDENTGLPVWNTVSIRKVSTHYEEVQERKRKRQREKDLAEQQQNKEKEIQARKMEEAKYANAHDSALGAYNVWSSSAAADGGDAGASGSYKGVDITKEVKVEVADTAKSLSKGMGSVAFKKKKKPRKNVRTTSADDD